LKAVFTSAMGHSVACTILPEPTTLQSVPYIICYIIYLVYTVLMLHCFTEWSKHFDKIRGLIIKDNLISAGRGWVWDIEMSHCNNPKVNYKFCSVVYRSIASFRGNYFHFQFCPSTDKKKLHGLSQRANYTDRETAACRQSYCQLLRIEDATWSAWRIPTAVF
jgi:hypothetical protein